MATQYTKREFLKLLGMSMLMLPFIGCYDFSSKNKKQESSDNPSGSKIPASEDATLSVTDEDVIILTRNQDRYARFNTAFNKRVRKFPECIAVCKTEKGVQYALQKAAAENLKVAVKSGGHSFEGFSSNDGGMVINLSLMKAINCLPDGTVELQPGCLLQEIQDAFFPKKKLLPAGSCGTVGIAGLTLGGGYGFFSREYGLTCDSLLRVKMVAANGRVYNSDEDADLLWACKGGGNGNFGVITSFTFRVYPMPATFSNYVLKFRKLDTAKFGLLLDTWFDVTGHLPADAFSAFVLNGTTLTVLLTHFKNHPEFGRLIAPMRNMANSYYPHPQQDLPEAMKKYYGQEGPLYFKNASAGMYRGKKDLDNIKSEIFKQVTGRKGLIFQINTLGAKVMDKAFEKASCFPHRQLPYLSELQAYWEQEGREAEMVQAFEQLQKVFKHNGITAHYRNYPDLFFEDWETAYYGKNYPKLQKIKKQYDPSDRFVYDQSIRPA